MVFKVLYIHNSERQVFESHGFNAPYILATTPFYHPMQRPKRWVSLRASLSSCLQYIDSPQSRSVHFCEQQADKETLNYGMRIAVSICLVRYDAPTHTASKSLNIAMVKLWDLLSLVLIAITICTQLENCMITA